MWATMAKMLPSLEGFGGPDGGVSGDGRVSGGGGLPRPGYDDPRIFRGLFLSDESTLHSTAEIPKVHVTAKKMSHLFN